MNLGKSKILKVLVLFGVIGVGCNSAMVAFASDAQNSCTEEDNPVDKQDNLLHVPELELEAEDIHQLENIQSYKTEQAEQDVYEQITITKVEDNNATNNE